ncbi:hypothetical protein ACFL96_07985 [Thermoproteota archaeon]
MGILDVATAPLKVGAHIAAGTVGRAASGIGGNIAAHAAMNSTRFQLRSFEGRLMFDDLKLAKYLKVYNKYKKHMMRYAVKKEGHAPRQIEKAYKKYKNHPQVLEKVLKHEIQIFTNYYKGLLQIIKEIELKEADAELQKNASLIKDIDQMKMVVKNVVLTAKIKRIALLETDFNEFLKTAEADAKAQEKEERKEMKEIFRETRGRKAVRGFAGFLGGITGINRLGHKLRKVTKKVITKDLRDFHKRLSVIMNDVEGKHVSNVTISELRFMVKNYTRIRKHYHEIDTDLRLIMDKLFKDFGEIQKKCVAPFYSSVRNIPGAKEIYKTSTELQEAYNKFSKELYKEKSEVKIVHDHLKQFIATANSALANIENSNKKTVQHFEQEMKLAA